MEANDIAVTLKLLLTLSLLSQSVMYSPFPCCHRVCCTVCYSGQVRIKPTADDCLQSFSPCIAEYKPFLCIIEDISKKWLDYQMPFSWTWASVLVSILSVMLLCVNVAMATAAVSVPLP